MKLLLCGILATYTSDDEDELPKPSREEDEQPIIMAPTKNNGLHALSNSPLQMLDALICTPSEGVSLDSFTNPHVIPPDDERPLMKSIQTLLMAYHEKLGHCSFHQLKELAEQNAILKKVAKIQPPKCPSCLYGKAN